MKTKNHPLTLGLLLVALLMVMTAVPVFAGQPPNILPQSFTIAENSPVGSPTSPVKVTAFEFEGQTLTYAITGGSGASAFSINSSNGNLTVSDNTLLDREERSSLSFEVTVTDTEGLSKAAIMTVNLTGVSEFPPSVTAGQVFDVDENSANGTLVGQVEVDDDDVDDTFTFTLVGESATNVFSVDASDGEIRVKTSAFVNHEVLESVTLDVKATDSGGANDTKTVTVNINDLNETPVVNNQTFAVSESEPAGADVGFVVATDPDVGDSLTYSIVGPSPFSINASTGLLKVQNPDGIDFESDPDITFTVKVTDSGSPAKEDTAVITVNVIQADDPPTADTIPDKVVNDGTTSTTVPLFPVFADDEDNDSKLELSVTNVSNTTLVTGTSINPGTGVLTLNLAVGVGGNSNVTVQAKDTADQTVSTTFKVIINEAPQADSIPDITRNEDQLNETLDLRDFFSDDVQDPEDLVYTFKNQPGGLFSTASINDYTLTLIGAPNANGKSTVTIVATDAQGLSAEGPIKVTVNAVNDPPTTTGIANVNVAEDAEPREINLWAAFSDIEDDDDQLAFVVANNSNPNLFDSVSINNGNGKLTLDFKANASGNATISIQAQDTGGLTVNTSFNVTVSSDNDRPVVEDFGKDTTEDTPVNFTDNDFINHYSDADEEPLVTVRITQLPDSNKGVLKLSGNDVALNQEIPTAQLDNLVFQPAANWDQGTATFKWNGSDGSQYAENPATVTITMTAAVNDPPVVSNFNKTVNENAVLGFGISDFVNAYFDVDGDPLNKVRIVSLPVNGTLRLNNSPVSANAQINRDNLDELTFTPTPGWSGQTSFQWNGSDGEIYADEGALVTVTVTPINDPPAVDLNGSGGGVNFAVVFNTNGSPVKIADSDATVSDPDSDTLASATIIIGNRKDGTAEQLTAEKAGTDLDISFNAANGIMTLEGPAPVEDFEAVIRTIRYKNTAPDANTAKRQISVRVTDDGQLLSPNAETEVTIINPKIRVNVTAETPTVISGTAAVFTVSISNSGDVPLTDITVTSAAVPDCNRNFPSLAAGQSLATYSCVRTNVTQRIDNEVVVTAADEQGGTQVTDQDTAIVKVESPNIRVDVAADPFVGDTILKGQEAKFIITALNPSQSVALQNVIVEAFTSPLPATDGLEPDQTPIPGCAKTIGDLNTGADTDYTCSIPNVQAPFSIEVVISGKIEGTNQVVEDFDILELNVLDLKVEVQADPFEILSGQQTKVRYNVTLTNNSSKDVTLQALRSETTGGQPLHGDLLNPNTPGLVSNTCDVAGDPPVLVATGGTYPCYYEVNITAQPPAFSNVIAASVEDDDENQVTAKATALVTVSDQSPLQMTLSAEPSSLVAPGGSVTLNLQLTNNQPGSAQLTALTDVDQGNLNGKGTCQTPQTIAGGGSYSCSYPATVADKDAGDVVIFTVSASVGGKTIADSIQVPITAKGTKQIMLPAVPHFSIAGEPNDSVCTAMAIAPDADYYFTPDDANDWYRFTLAESGPVTVKISNYVATGQIVVYKGSCDAPTFIQNNGDNGVVLNRDVSLGTQSAGTYFIWVLADGQQTATKPYVLRVETD